MKHARMNILYFRFSCLKFADKIVTPYNKRRVVLNFADKFKLFNFFLFALNLLAEVVYSGDGSALVRFELLRCILWGVSLYSSVFFLIVAATWSGVAKNSYVFESK